MNCESDQFKSAQAHIALCSDPVWAPADGNEYTKANQELWIRICRIQERYERERRCTCNGHFHISETHSAQCGVWQNEPRHASTLQLPSYLESDSPTCRKYLSDECVTNYHDDLIEPWMAPVELYFQTLSKEEATDFSGRSSYSAMLQKHSDAPLQSLNSLLTRNNRQWLGTSNWYEVMKSFYPTLKIEYNEETKMNGVKSNSTYYDNNAGDKFSEDQLVLFRYSIESAEEKRLEESLNNKKIRKLWDTPAIRKDHPSPPAHGHHARDSKHSRSQHLNAEVPEFHPKVSGATTSSTTTITTQNSVRANKQVGSTSSLLNLTENKQCHHASEHGAIPLTSSAKDAKYPNELFPYRILANSRSERQLTSCSSARYHDSQESEQLFTQDGNHSNRSHKYMNNGITSRPSGFSQTPVLQKSREVQDINFKYPITNNTLKEKETLTISNQTGKKSRCGARKETHTWFSDHGASDRMEIIYPLDFDAHLAITQWIRTGYSTRANDFNYVSALMSDTSIMHPIKDDVAVVPRTECDGDNPAATETFPDLTTVKAPEVRHRHSNKKSTKKITEVRENLEPKKRLYSAVLSNSTPGNDCIMPLVDLPINELIHPPSPSTTSDLDSSCNTQTSQSHPEIIDEEFPQLSPDVSKKTASTGSMEKCYEELERQAIEQYKESDESLDSKYYQELERQAVEQYSASIQSNMDNPSATSSMDSSMISTDTTTLYTVSPRDTALKIDVVNYIKLSKASPKQKKKGKKRKSKRSNLKNGNSPHVGADLKSHAVSGGKCSNASEQIQEKVLDYFIIQYSYKCKAMNLKLLVHDDELSRHMKNIVREFKSGIICKQCRIFPLMSSIEELYNGLDVHYFPIEECCFTDLNYLPQIDDESCMISTMVYFEGQEIEVFREVSNILFNTTSVRLMIPSRCDMENFKKFLPKSAIEKKIIKHSANSYDSSQTNRHFLQTGVRPINNCNVFCHFLYYSVRHEFNDYANLKLMGFEKVRRLVDHVRAVWRAAKGCYTSGIFYDGIPLTMPIKLWSPLKYYLRSRRIYKDDRDVTRDRISDSILKLRTNGKVCNQITKSGPFRTLHTFIDSFEIKYMIESEYIYTMLNLQKHFSGMVHYKYYAKFEECEENIYNAKLDCEFIRSMSGILRSVNTSFSETPLDHVGLFGKYIDTRQYNASIYHMTPDILERHWLFMWGFLAVDLNICDPWNYNNHDLLNEKYPIYYPKFVVRKPIEPLPLKPLFQNPQLCSCKHPYTAENQYLNSAKNKKAYLQLSEQQKGDLKSMIALTLNKEIKSKEDVQKISVTMSKLIKDEIIEKLEQMTVNKKLNTEKGMIVKSAEKIHRKIINSTFTEIVLELCRGRKVKDSDLERKEQIFAAMIEHLKQIYHLKNEVQGKNGAIQMAIKTNHASNVDRHNNTLIGDQSIIIDSSRADKQTVDIGMQTTGNQNSNCLAQYIEDDDYSKHSEEIIKSDDNHQMKDGPKYKSRAWKKRDDRGKRSMNVECKTKSLSSTTMTNDIIHKITRYSPRPNRKNYTPPIVESVSQTSNTSEMVLGEEEEDEENIHSYDEVADKKLDSSCGVM